jgi:hypothetical protein
MSQLDWPITKRTKKKEKKIETMKAPPKIEDYIERWSTTIGEEGRSLGEVFGGRTLGKTYGIRGRYYWEHPWGNTLGT